MTTPALVKELRQRSGAGILECKKALDATQGDIEKAFDVLRKSGQAKAAKKAANAVGEGIVALHMADDRKQAALIELNCQTDFVARNELFSEFAKALLNIVMVLPEDQLTVEHLLQQPMGEGQTVDQAREALVAKTGENIQIARFTRVQAEGRLFSYVHDQRIAAIVDMNNDEEAVGKDIAMHVAASSPLVVNAEDVPHEILDKEREIYVTQFEESGKPEAIRDKIVLGKMNKFVCEVSLLGQPFIKEPKQTVAQHLKSSGASVHSFVRYQLNAKQG